MSDAETQRGREVGAALAVAFSQPLFVEIPEDGDGLEQEVAEGFHEPVEPQSLENDQSRENKVCYVGFCDVLRYLEQQDVAVQEQDREYGKHDG